MEKKITITESEDGELGLSSIGFSKTEMIGIFEILKQQIIAGGIGDDDPSEEKNLRV